MHASTVWGDIHYQITGMNADTPTTSAITAKSPAGPTHAIALIHNASRGHPRAVNNLALQALTAASAADHAIVDEKAARVVITETAAD